MKVLMVCLGNICRSPLAHGILESRVKALGMDWEVDSAGTSGWHVGEPPDSRSVQEANLHGIDISRQRSRQFVSNDFSEFDLILAMDSSNYNNVIALAKNESEREMVKMILNYSHPGQNRTVPDPYYNDGFDTVYNMLAEAVDKLIESHTK